MACDLALEWVPDVVLCDIGLPGLNGYGVARELRARARDCADVLLVALTAFSREEDRQEALRRGVRLPCHQTRRPGQAPAPALCRRMNLLVRTDLDFKS